MISESVQRKFPAYAGIIHPVFNFAGGLNTKSSALFLDSSAKFALRPDQLIRCDNLLRTASGALITRPGRVKLNATPVAPPSGSAEVRSIFELRRTDGTNRIIINAGNTIYRWDGSAFVSVGTVATPDTRFAWTQFGNLAIGADGVNAPIKYDGTTLNSLGGTPPPNGISPVHYQNRVWMIQGNTLYGSALGAPEDWISPNNAVQLPIPVSRGKGGTALLTLWSRLMVFADEQVFQLTGTGPSNFAVKAINLKYGHSGNPYGVMAAGNDVYYFNNRGMHGLSVTEAQAEVGDVAVKYATAYIEPTWQDIASGNFTNIVTINDVMRNLLIVLCNTNGNTNAEALVGDYYHLDEAGHPTWSRYTNMPFSSACQVTSLNSTPEILFGDYSGTVYRQTDAETDDGVTIPIQGTYLTDLTMPGWSKTWRHLLVYTQAAEGRLRFDASFDFGAHILNREIDMTQSFGDIIGSTFTMGVSALGSITLKPKRISLPGHGRFLTLNFGASVARRVTIGGFIFYGDLRRVIQ